MGQCHCVFPAAGEEEVATIPGDEPGTALRVYASGGCDGYVRLQQMVYSDGLGWYVQKSMVLPRDVLATLVPTLRKALCLMPTPSRPECNQPPAVLRLAGAPKPAGPALEPTGTTGDPIRLFR